MKKLVFLIAAFVLVQVAAAQDNKAMVDHYKKFYDQMNRQGDPNGMINALTHLQVLEPSQTKLDSIAFYYAKTNQHLQALNTIGIERNVADSDLAVRVKAASLKALGQIDMAIQQVEILFKRNANPYLAYELADLKIQVGNSSASEQIEYGLANSTEEMKKVFNERQQPYEVPLKAAFLHLKGVQIFGLDNGKTDEAISYMDQALEVAPNFNLAQISKEALEKRKSEGSGTPRE